MYKSYREEEDGAGVLVSGHSQVFKRRLGGLGIPPGTPSDLLLHCSRCSSQELSQWRVAGHMSRGTEFLQFLPLEHGHACAGRAT